ncbi:MAG TPA: ABC transporter permease [Candidatus Aminicenantes bacterium]|nr:ABC transporter permease [Candidatus Aminicenantes bacterium]
MSLSYRIAYVFLRNLYSYKRFILPTFLVSLVEPLFYLVTFGVGMGAYMGAFGGRPYLHFLVPGVLASTAMMSSSFECLYGTFVKIVHEKVYDSLVATPVSADDAVAGDIAWGSFRGLVSGGLMMTVALAMGVAPAAAWRALVLVLFLVFIGVLFGSLAMIVTSISPSFDFFSYYTELVITPMLFFSGVFFPLDRFPGWMKALAEFLPLTHAVRVSRALFGGAAAPGLGWSLALLAAVAAAAFTVSVRMMRKRLIK